MANRRLTKANKLKKIDIIVRGVCIYWCLFVAVAWITYWVKDSVPEVLVTMGLGGGGLELVITGVLEITRDRLGKGGIKNDDGEVDE